MLTFFRVNHKFAYWRCFEVLYKELQTFQIKWKYAYWLQKAALSVKDC
jgi:hypothetical protein